ncbi:MAG: DUF952 domain-containing protein [Nocardioidaceae bacterium]|nr:DUF952 domain-containing protein [Nocardioidaceae bacterium]MCL2614025.1 DUF952 domain-containing protein [Nocardioidaceae bacterium]
MATIFHLALVSDWEAAQASGTYLISTRGRTLAEQGFIHASRGDQWPRVREAVYADVTDPMVLLQIDTERLGVPVVEEPGEPGSSETFPHIYGPLPVAAVVKAIPLDSPGVPPDPAPAARPAETGRHEPTVSVEPATLPTQASFTKTYFREMFFNCALILLVLALGAGGLLLGGAMGSSTDGAGAYGGLVGLVMGGLLAVWLYRRRA